MGIWNGLAEAYATAFKNFAGTWFLMLILGATFGKIMEESGAAASISNFIVGKLGKQRIVLIVLITTAILAYGGISVFVIMFTMYPFCMALFKEADIPKKLFPAMSICMAAVSYTHLDVYKRQDKRAREEMSLAAFEAGVAFNNSSVTVVHGMSRPIGALFHVAHGISNAMLLEACLSYVMDGAYGRFADLGRAIGTAENGDTDREAAKKFLDQVVALCKELEIPTLSEYGIDKEEFFRVMDKICLLYTSRCV